MTKRMLISTDEAEVVVVGAGPAGAAAAITLSQLGREVILVDQHRFPRDKPCGDALWFGAVRSIMELGLSSVVTDALQIEATRIVRAEGESAITRKFAASSQRFSPRCIPRLQFDASLFEASREAGVRFVLGRVVETVEEDGRVEAVVIRRQDGQRRVIRAREFIAADGSTSRMRRIAGFTTVLPGAGTFAVRQYCRTEKVLDPVLETTMPIAFGANRLPGYGWVFPISEHIANIGLGFYRGLSDTRHPQPSLRDLLTEFVEQLQSGSKSRFGSLEVMSDPVGAPLAVKYSTQTTRKANVLFAGDAAQMTDPLTGEGISASLRSGVAAAREVDRTLKFGTKRDYGAHLQREFPRLGQDTGIILRNLNHFVSETGPSVSSGRGMKQAHPFVEHAFSALIGGSDDDANIEETRVFQIAVTQRAEASEAFHELNRKALDAARTEFPFALDLMHRRLRAGCGPSIAATLIFTALANENEVGPRSIARALSLEFLSQTRHFLSQVTDGGEPNPKSLGNAMAILVADHALSLGLKCTTDLSTDDSTNITRLTQAVVEGAAADAENVWNLERTADDYLDAANDADGSLHSRAAELGLRHSQTQDISTEIQDFGRSLGLAMRISNDVTMLLSGDRPTAHAPGDGLRHGEISLPVIYALEGDPELKALLTPSAIDNTIEEVLSRIRATSAIERCVTQCAQYAKAAHSALDDVEIEDPAALLALVQLAVDRCGEQAPKY